MHSLLQFLSNDGIGWRICSQCMFDAILGSCPEPELPENAHIKHIFSENNSAPYPFGTALEPECDEGYYASEDSW